MRNRVLLISLTVAAWLCLKVIDYLVPWPAIMVLLCATLFIMVTHSVWLMLAQRRWRKKQKRISDLAAISAASFAPDEQAASAAEADTQWEPWVDIFISAKNESRVIEQTVRNFFKLDYANLFLWVIDDCSDDDMPKILERLKDEFANLRVVTRVPGCRPGKSAALNEALALAKGEVVAVFDADAYVAPDFLKLLLPVLETEGVGGVQAQKRIYQHQKGFLVDCQASEYALDTYFQMGRDLIGGAVEFRGNGQLMKRSALIDVGGWNNLAITDDLDLTMKMLVSGWSVRFVPHAHVWEEGVTTLKGWMRQRRRWAEGSIRRYLDYIFPLNSPTRLSLVERIDILAFISEFAIPALMLLEGLSEAFSFATGHGTHGHFLMLVAMAVFFISLVNFFIAIRIYRSNLSWLDALKRAFETNVYVYVLWVPCVVQSFLHILTGRQASKWHRTEHGIDAPALEYSNQ